VPEATTGWLPVLTLVLGYGLKSISDWVEHRRTSEREREARAATRKDQQVERRIEFQRKTLLELQDTVMDVARTTGSMHVKDLTEYRESGKWQRQLFPEDLAEQNRLAHARMAMLASRVRDDTVRLIVGDFKDAAVKSTMSPAKDESEQALSRMMTAFEALNQRIGELLRLLDDEG
jgi:hypothetical protein